jgi:hypothetical protein
LTESPDKNNSGGGGIRTVMAKRNETNYWRGVLIEESLNDLSILHLLRIVETNLRALEGQSGRKLTFHKVEVADSDIKAVLHQAVIIIKSGWYLHLVRSGVMKVIFSGRVFEINDGDHKKFQEVRRYGITQGIKEEQLGLERLMIDPFG